ncbi:ABC-F family ATP-binding cassette domain-containing protein [Aminipila luticellarii]|uniref:ABC-F family ATP-binding cassette domain-containing protein n=1 Tax=Aminipila luticellarii TaxID=2507160 RepID=A0A410PWC4_9FIRM|nr:ABC-F family ATP-binding cassette domain-containing protein [Aminipila luticellarii]QAT43186.1 ABC-F family ATP-binding cassette domain-containing protein [Aminipila luticellarii]
MSLLIVENVSHGFGGRTILEDASFRLLKGEHVGLIGANGEGKSTFLNIIIGNIQPDEGKVEWSKNVTVGYLDQHSSLKSGMTIRDVLREAFKNMFELEKKMLSMYDQMADENADVDALMEEAGEIQQILDHSGFYTIDAKINEIAGGLGLASIGLDKDVSELSGGQRTKVLLTKLLLEDPSILLLDEPTNYLDFEHIEWLKRYLQEYENAFILISHDVEFLNSVVNVIYHVNNGELTRYTGDYDNFLHMHEIKQKQQERAYERQQAEIERMEDFIARNKARVATRGMANSRQKMLDRIEVIEKPREKPKPSFQFREARTPSRYLVQTKDLILGYSEPLTKPLNFEIERGMKLAITGTNGLGKTTLLKTILGKIKALGGTAELGDYLAPGYFEQEAGRDSEITALDYIWSKFPSYTNGEVRAALAKCGLTTEHITSQMRVLSGGENAKVRLCELMQKEANWLILDEPTNHLDVEAKEELKKALMEYKGSILLVCHEPLFYEDWVTDVWNVEDWTLKIV